MLVTNKPIGKNIAIYRKARGLSRAKLAAIVGMDANHLYCIEIGRRYPSINTLARLAVALRVSMDWLAGNN